MLGVKGKSQRDYRRIKGQTAVTTAEQPMIVHVVVKLGIKVKETTYE
jgi:signal recognition particle subunit SEC65